MAMSQEQALEEATKLRQSVRRARRRQDSVWALNMAYATNHQWSWIAQQGSSVRQVKRLREIINPDRTDVRVSLDLIHAPLKRTVAALKSQRIAAIIRMAGGDTTAQTSHHVYNEALRAQLNAMGALKVWRSLQLPRCVLGTSLLRRQILTSGRPVTLPEDYWHETKKPLRLRKLEVRWARAQPFEILRDPTADDPDFNQNDNIIGHEKPRTLQWLKRNFNVDVQTESTMGDLMSYQDQLRSVTGWWWQGDHARDSRQGGVMVFEFFLRDPDAEEDWAYHLMAYNDPKEEDDKLVPFHFGKNPFYGLPIHPLSYDTTVGGCWARGMPELLKPYQDIKNIAVTTIARTMIQHGYPRWVMEEGTVEDPSKAFTNRADQVLSWKRNREWDKPPFRAVPPPHDPSATDLINMTSEEADRNVGVAPVMQGQMVKRGQAGKAYEAVIGQAEVPLNDLRKDDELTLNEALMGTLIDGIRLLRQRRDVAQGILGRAFSEDQIATALRQDPADLVEAVEVTPESLRHRTPREIRDDYAGAVKDQWMSPIDAQRQMLAQGDIVTNVVMADARQKQQIELETMLAGGEAKVNAAEDHATSEWILQRFCSSPRYLALPEEIQLKIQKHWAQHKQAALGVLAFEQSLMQAGQPAGQPSAPGGPAGQPEEAGAVAPEMAVA